jgi:hypothetical protein
MTVPVPPTQWKNSYSDKQRVLFRAAYLFVKTIKIKNMKHLKHLKLLPALLAMALLPVMSKAQCGGEKPVWATTTYHKELKNSHIETIVQWGASFEEVRKKVYEEVARRAYLRTGARVAKLADDLSNVEQTVASQPIGEYWECEPVYTGYFLMQTKKRLTVAGQPVPFEKTEFTDKYGFSARALVPGMAQFYKGSVLKGALIIAGEVAFVGGIIATESLRASYNVKANATHNTSDRQVYMDYADGYGNVRNILIGAAAALYVYNIIDAIAARGKPHLVVLGKNTLQMAPFASPEAGGITFALHF